MHLNLAAVGQRPPAWVKDAWNQYRKRFPPNLQVGLREIPLAHRGRNPDLQRARKQEGEAMLAAIGDDARVVALEVTGKRWSTEELAQRLQHWMEESRDLWFLVGGPDGLDAACLQRANERWSLGPLTLPHALVRIVVIEQLYRAWTILTHHPYHRAG